MGLSCGLEVEEKSGEMCRGEVVSGEEGGTLVEIGEVGKANKSWREGTTGPPGIEEVCEAEEALSNRETLRSKVPLNLL